MVSFVYGSGVLVFLLIQIVKSFNIYSRESGYNSKRPRLSVCCWQAGLCPQDGCTANDLFYRKLSLIATQLKCNLNYLKKIIMWRWWQAKKGRGSITRIHQIRTFFGTQVKCFDFLPSPGWGPCSPWYIATRAAQTCSDKCDSSSRELETSLIGKRFISCSAVSVKESGECGWEAVSCGRLGEQITTRLPRFSSRC